MKQVIFSCFIIQFLNALPIKFQANPSDFYVGVGIGDVTGPAAEIAMMGYAQMSQTTQGIHMRVYARAFVFAEGPNSPNRFAFVSVDLQSVSQLVKLDVAKELRKLYGTLYTVRNLMLSATHTHSATAGYFQYLLYQATSLGFVKESHDQIVKGIVRAIRKAHLTMKPAKLYLNSGELKNCQVNRSPAAYLNNPMKERANYRGDTDTTMHLLRIDHVNGTSLGMINWFPVHGTSMNQTNRLISGDNKGYASQMFEREMNPEGTFPGHGPFVAAFAQSAEGDVTPNTKRPHCLNSDLPCDLSSEESACMGQPTQCVAFGPGRDMFESTRIIGDLQFKKAIELFLNVRQAMNATGVRIVQKYVDMANYSVELPDGRRVRTCLPALGYSFAAGTTDGVADMGMFQGQQGPSGFWESVRNTIKPATAEMIKCHSPKPILLATGLMTTPYAFHPRIVDVQLAKVGNLVIAAVPGEFTTMAGRRLTNALTRIFSEVEGGRVRVVIAGLSNLYTHYITTPEEYNQQMYEGASNIYGPFALPAYIQVFSELAVALIKGETVPPGPRPPYLKDLQWSVVPPVVFDNAGVYQFGDVLQTPRKWYHPGDVVKVVFVGGHPRNSVGRNGHTTFLCVQKLVCSGGNETQKTAMDPTKPPDLSTFENQYYYDENNNFDSHNDHELNNNELREEETSQPSGSYNLMSVIGKVSILTNQNDQLEQLARHRPIPGRWKTILTDADWETRFTWQRDNFILGTSNVTLEWFIPQHQSEGIYRLCYFGHRKSLPGSIEQISGCSRNFVVLLHGTTTTIFC